MNITQRILTGLRIASAMVLVVGCGSTDFDKRHAAPDDQWTASFPWAPDTLYIGTRAIAFAQPLSFDSVIAIVGPAPWLGSVNDYDTIFSGPLDSEGFCYAVGNPRDSAYLSFISIADVDGRPKWVDEIRMDMTFRPDSASRCGHLSVSPIQVHINKGIEFGVTPAEAHSLPFPWKSAEAMSSGGEYYHVEGLVSSGSRALCPNQLVRCSMYLEAAYIPDLRGTVAWWVSIWPEVK